MPNLTETGFSGKVTESQIVRVWQRQLLDKAGLATEDGRPLEVIYPGRLNDDRGADFRDAVISTNRRRLKGDVELHVRSSDWHSHGHDRDAWYNRVILHVVLWHNCQGSTRLQDGREVPILALEKYVGADSFSPSASPGPPCVHATPEAIAASMDKAGEARFLNQAARFRDILGRVGAGQALFEGIMAALGYAKNKEPFLELAGRLPLQALESVTQSHFPDADCLECLQALLLAAAGLRPDLCFADSMSPQSWNTFKVRPQNSPVNRILAMSHLLIRYRQRGLFDECTGKLLPANRDEDKLAYDMLEETFIVVAANQIGRTVTLLGRERSAVIVINVLLPFSYAFGQFTGQPTLMQKTLNLYRHYPRRMGNSIEKHMIYQLGLSHTLINSVRRQQGLIHIYKGWCIQGRCTECALSQPQSGQHIHV